MENFLSYQAWLADPRNSLEGDPVWRVTAFRRALYCADIAWLDVGRLARVSVTAGIAGQLYRSLGSIGANLTEGYSRSSGPDRARLYEFSLGSSRESIVWYRLARPVLGDELVAHRQDQLQHVVRLLSTMIPDQRHVRIDRRT
jgi:four helix bundle protein